MDVLWVGTVSTVVGAVVGALLQAWREHAVHRRELAVRWDETLLTGLAEYLATADRTLRALLRWRRARDAGADGLDAIAAAALESYESLHEQSQLITLLTGDRTDPLRASARRMRQSLLPLCEELHDGTHLDPAQVSALITTHRTAREALILHAQKNLKNTPRRPPPTGAAP
ncbi:hypothetical protein [Streptomyces sp. NPDC002564]|uniref:hypothetical protein n=1 Tax=Streptomyces sp. NPDC002564 TaxID=3364649 RepID=UPI0036992E0D